ncbi:SDR family oxidoreductase [Truepera radiovictrix]|uniref:Short-chain dehydrogenase/reductase SDR n=1 Tax=Truepera radiovictrix (strain DSM 17093 / CIP 108686 / LMG 22925 / RQ-24) TaxID=649638 RepID=D7CUX6_TRURR|nr:SDR family oxidoreductase [Truepera radiovictrix]ADI15803.1 short-chain dehydrogenase/reductase SDR [Truepera radiovictrix DSM 17093]WMT58569.1 SDR family oxidoreductase [Truepera radiovictrix]
METNLQGKTALITGGSKGIGYGVAEALVREGMNVTITARTQSEVEAAAERLSGVGPGRALGLTCNVRNFDEQRAVVEETVSTFGGLDVLVANAGVGHFAPVDELSLEQWHDVIDTNLTGVFYSVKAALDALKKGGGYVITISSLAGRNPMPGGAAYNASKFGLNGFSEAVMLDLRQHDIKVSYIMPGSVATHFNGHTPSEADAWKIQPEDIAEITLMLLKMPARTLPSRVEVRPSKPPTK